MQRQTTHAREGTGKPRGRREVLECFAGLHEAVQEEAKEEGEDEEENVPLQVQERTPNPTWNREPTKRS